MKLTEFLLARIAEDEAMAERGASAPSYDHYGDSAWEESYEMSVAEGCSEEGKAFIRHMSPARVTAECEAKRRIVEMHTPDHECTTPDDGYAGVFMPDGPGALTACPTLLLLALPYADHPDYDPAWA